MISKKILGLIIIVIIVLATMVSFAGVTYAWFIGSDLLTTEPINISTAPTVMSLDIKPLGDNRYMGQTGKDAGLDAPYRKNFSLSLRCNAVGQKNVKININDLVIKLWNYSHSPESKYLQVLSEEQIRENFTFRLQYEGKIYIPDSQGYLYCLENNFIKYLFVSTGEIIDGMLTLIYLGEESYVKWQANDFESYDEFAFCAPDYMESTFSFSLEFLLGDADLEYNNRFILELPDKGFIPKSGISLADTHKYTVKKTFVSNIKGYETLNQVLKAYIAGVTIINNNGEHYQLNQNEIKDNFTLRIKSQNIEYGPERGEEALADYFYAPMGQNAHWLIMQAQKPYAFDISVIGQDETDYANMVNNSSYVPATPFAYGTTEYSGCTFIYDIRFEMHEIPMKEHNYAVGTQTVIGFSNNPAYCLPAYDGQKGLTIDTTYIFNRTIALTPSATKTIKATIDSVTIVHADGSIEYLSGSQIRDNFTLRFRYGNNVYEPYSSTMLPQRNNYFYRELSVFQNEWLEIPKDMASSLSVDIVYQDESDYARLLEGQSFTPSAFAFNASKYASASFYFEIKIEMVDTPW